MRGRPIKRTLREAAVSTPIALVGRWERIVTNRSRFIQQARLSLTPAVAA